MAHLLGERDLAGGKVEANNRKRDHGRHRRNRQNADGPARLPRSKQKPDAQRQLDGAEIAAEMTNRTCERDQRQHGDGHLHDTRQTDQHPKVPAPARRYRRVGYADRGQHT